MKTYTFHVSLPGTGRTWRKIELRADQTLEELHFAIQDAFEWDADHLYSFFMSGKAWDENTEYALPEDADPWGVMLEEDEFDDDEFEAEFDDDFFEDEVPPPRPPSLSEQDRAIIIQIMAEQFGFPPKVTEESLAILDQLSQPLTDPGDVRITTLESLNLQLDQTFLYLFDYGDEHRFKVRVHAINETADPEAEYPCIVESVGKAPPQYPDWDE